MVGPAGSDVQPESLIDATAPPEPGWSEAAIIVILQGISVLATPDFQATWPGAELDRATWGHRGSRDPRIGSAGRVPWLVKG